MSFKELTIKIGYDGDSESVLNEFIIPTLSIAKTYDRLAGYFSSSSLAQLAKGLEKFIENDGKMRLITSTQFSGEDIEAINKGILRPEEVISKKFIKEFEEIENQFVKDHVEALSWMLVEGYLEIKIAVMEDNPIFHPKVGILNDGKNIIAFTGSLNETGPGLSPEGNIENCDIFCDWKSGQDEYCSRHALTFEKFWSGSPNRAKIYDLPSAIKEYLLKSVPHSKEEAVAKIKKSKFKKNELYGFQKKAIEAWFASKKMGIFEMATGTGKTRTTISCIQKLFQEKKDQGLLIVITCPGRDLANQWVETLCDFGFTPESAFGDSKIWSKDIGNNMENLNNGIIENLIIVTENSTFPTSLFTEMINLCQTKTMLVADEVHSLANNGRQGLLSKYNYRLALSATPERYFDDDGTKKIFNFFGKVVFTFDISDAIPEYLTPYELIPHFIEMTNKELVDYNDVSKSIAIKKQNKEIDENKIIELLLFERQRIVKKATNKIQVLREIISKNKKLNHCLVYCADQEQLEEVHKILHEKKIIFSRFTAEEEPKERIRILKNFKDNVLDVLLAIKCLDQGIDIPSTKIAIIMASTGNPIEFIQRRGRILRKHAGKELAIIHDIIVMPPKKIDSEYSSSEQSILRKELLRLKEFAEPANNSEDIMPKIDAIMKEYGLT